MKYILKDRFTGLYLGDGNKDTGKSIYDFVNSYSLGSREDAIRFSLEDAEINRRCLSAVAFIWFPDHFPDEETLNKLLHVTDDEDWDVNAFIQYIEHDRVFADSEYEADIEEIDD